MLHAVIMAGGSGTRFWPQSRKQRPKQLLQLAGEGTLLQDTVARVADWTPPERTWIVTNRDHAAETAAQIPSLPAGNLLQEPCGRNTAPCIGLAAIQIAERDPEGSMLVMPADHVIGTHAQFRQAVEQAAAIIDGEPAALVLFGVKPTWPSTGFGYIERGAVVDGSPGAYRVAAFREKPDRATAETFLTAGRFYWNCGIFVWKAPTILDALRQFEPDMFDRLRKLQPAVGRPTWEQSLAAEFPAMRSVSIDYAVLERARQVYVVEAPFGWDDVGSWQAMARLRGVDEAGNTIDGPHCGVDTAGCIVRTTDDHLVATIGLSDCIVVHTPDATLVARKDDEEGIRKLIELLRERGHERFL